MKKFYKVSEAGTAPGGYVVRLDGKPLRTPMKNVMLLESRPLADAIALEWAGQGDEVRPVSMPLTQLANTMIDKTRGDERAEMNGTLLEYGGSDLVCYLATHPESLVRLHQQHWLPLLRWMKEEFGIILEPVSGIQYHHQPKESLDKLQRLIEGLEGADFTVAQAASATTGSVVIAFALLRARLTAEDAYQASCVDEIYQIKTWGDDAEAQKRLDAVRAELEAIARFRDLVKA